MNFELFKEYNRATLDHHAAMRDRADYSYLYTLEELTRRIIRDLETNVDEIKAYKDRRAMYIAGLINHTDGEERESWIDALIGLVSDAYEAYSYHFEDLDVRVRLLSMRRFMATSTFLKSVDEEIVQSSPELRDWLAIYFATKEKCRLPKDWRNHMRKRLK